MRATGATALFSAGVPDKMIREVTGHRSNALELYERPSMAQREAVSGILVQGKKSFAQEVEKGGERSSDAQVQQPKNPVMQPIPPRPGQLPDMVRCLFSSMNNCSLQNFVVNINTPATERMADASDGLFDGITLEDLL